MSGDLSRQLNHYLESFRVRFANTDEAKAVPHALFKNKQGVMFYISYQHPLHRHDALFIYNQN